VFVRSDRRRLRGALIGLGGIAHQSHLPGFRTPAAAERLEIVATVDRSPDARPAADLPLLRTVEELSLLGPLDFVDICTPTASHLELILWALDQGCHVLCEKPVAVTADEASTIRAAALRAGRVVFPCHQYRYNPVWRQVKHWLEGGAIGRWHLAEFEVYRPKADPGAGRTALPWRGRSADSRGGVLLDHGTHLIYELLDVAGVPLRIQAWTGRLLHASYDVEDSAQLLLEYPDRLGRMFLTWAAHHRENRIRFIGELGTIEWRGGQLSIERAGLLTTEDRSAELDKSAYAAWFGDLFAAFADAVDAGDLTSGLDDIARVAEVFDAAYAAGVPLAGDSWPKAG
jgi:predicted dehydrogenase